MHLRTRVAACTVVLLFVGLGGDAQVAEQAGATQVPAAQEPTPQPTPEGIVIPPDGVGPAAEAAAKEQLYVTETTSRHGMVACGSREASAAGARILEAGGNAVDAAVATAFALGVVEPGQSGLGGQTFILVHTADGRDFAIEGAAAAPLRPRRDELRQLMAAGRSNGYAMIATPGSVAALGTAAERFGTRPLAALVAPAIELALMGSTMTRFQRASLENYLERVRSSAYSASLYLKDGKTLWEPDHRFCQEDLARTLWRIGTYGWRDFYSGEISREIARDMEAHGGHLAWGDLDQVQATIRPALRGKFRGLDVVSSPPPCAGAAVIEALQILDRFPAEAVRPWTPDALHVLVEAQRMSCSDESNIRSLDSQFTWQVISPAQAARRAAQIDLTRITPAEAIAGAVGGEWRDRDTTQISVVDRYGNAVSLTQSLGRGFGACVATPGLGFPYNAILESFDTDMAGSRYYLFPLRRIFTSIAPTIVLRNGKPMIVVGSAGSSHIGPVIESTIVNVVDRGLSLGAALAAPRVLWGGGRLLWELAPPIMPATVLELGNRGFNAVSVTTFPASEFGMTNAGGANAVLVTPDGTMVGSCDPRRGGEPVGARAPSDAKGEPVPPTALWRDALHRPNPTPPPGPSASPQPQH